MKTMYKIYKQTVLQSITSSPRTAKTLANSSGISESDDTCPQTREIIRDLIDGGAIIGSCSKGYFRMETGKEVQEYMNSLLKMQMGISKRILSVYNSALKGGLL